MNAKYLRDGQIALLKQQRDHALAALDRIARTTTGESAVAFERWWETSEYYIPGNNHVAYVAKAAWEAACEAARVAAAEIRA